MGNVRLMSAVIRFFIFYDISIMNLNKFCIILLNLLLVPIICFSQRSLSNDLKKLNLREEIYDWTLTTAIGATNFFYLEHADTWRQNAAFRTNYKPFTNRKTLSSSLQVLSSGGLITAVFLLPLEKKYQYLIKYQHVKGIIQANGAYLPFVTSIAKLAAAKKRPDYKDRLESGLDTIEGKKSFWSGHAASAMGVATYLNLYLYHYVGENNKSNLYWKIPFTAGVYSAAAYIGWTRYHDNVHDVADIVSGAVAGSAIACLSFYLRERWLKKNIIKSNDRVSVRLFPNFVSFEIVL